MPIGRENQAKLSLTKEQYKLGVERLKIASAIEYTLYGVPTLYYGDEAGMTGWADPFNRGCMDWSGRSELIDWFAMLGQIRRKSNVFARGCTNLEFVGRRVLVFSRESETEKIYTAVNLSKLEVELKFTNIVTDLISGERGEVLPLKPQSVRIIEEKK